MKQILSHTNVIRTGLTDFIAAKKLETHPAVPWQDDVLDRLLPFVTGGKLLRGCLVCFSYEAFSGQSASEDVLKAAMALELTHSTLLIHDDIMDNDAVRRGGPSMHEQYKTLGEREHLAQAERFGMSMALGAGDMAIFVAFELLAGNSSEVTRLYKEQLAITCAGQMQDLYLQSQTEMPSKQTIIELMETKTASYTLSLPLAIGAALAGQPPSVLERLQAIGVAAGTIFQIRDDELGAMGDTRQTGKPVGSDITEGKKTLLYYYLLEQCTENERKKILAIFGNASASREDISYIQKLVRQHDIPAILNNEIERLEEQALAGIAGLAVTEKVKKELLELVRFCARRTS